MVAQVRLCRAGQRASAETRPRDRPAESRSPMQGCAGRSQRAACPTEIAVAEPRLLRGNSGDRCPPPLAQNQSSRRHRPRKSPAGDNQIATEGRWPSQPEPHPPQVAAPIVQRLAVQLQARRRVGVSILHDIPAAGLSVCNGLFGCDGTTGWMKVEPDDRVLVPEARQNHPQAGTSGRCRVRKGVGARVLGRCGDPQEVGSSMPCRS